MEEKKNNDGFCINVYSPGNFIAKEITFTGTVNIGSGNTETNGYSDEQIAQAIQAINGTKKPLNSKRKWAGALWMLRWECNYPARAQDFCDRIKQLPLPDGLEYPCEYNNIRMLATLSFMNEDPRQMDKVRYSPNDKKDFFQLKEVAIALGQELRKIREMEERV